MQRVHNLQRSVYQHCFWLVVYPFKSFTTGCLGGEKHILNCSCFLVEEDTGAFYGRKLVNRSVWTGDDFQPFVLLYISSFISKLNFSSLHCIWAYVWAAIKNMLEILACHASILLKAYRGRGICVWRCLISWRTVTTRISSPSLCNSKKKKDWNGSRFLFSFY